MPIWHASPGSSTRTSERSPHSRRDPSCPAAGVDAGTLGYTDEKVADRVVRTHRDASRSTITTEIFHMPLEKLRGGSEYGAAVRDVSVTRPVGETIT